MSYLLSRNIFILLALVALLVCVFLPSKIMTRPTYNFLVTFDISQSMNVMDVALDDAPRSRRAMSKHAARELLQALPCGSRVGWSVFTGRRVLSLLKPVEVCEHYAGLLQSLEFIDGRMRWANASGIGKGLHQSIRAADDIGNKTTVVFMTDGHEAPPLRVGSRGMPDTAKYDIDGLIVGVGGEAMVRIPKVDIGGNIIGYWQADEVVQQAVDTGRQSQEELSSRKDGHLRNLGRLSGLEYLPLLSAGVLAQAALNPRFASEKEAPVDQRWIPACIALLLLCLRFFPSRRTL